MSEKEYNEKIINLNNELFISIDDKVNLEIKLNQMIKNEDEK